MKRKKIIIIVFWCFLLNACGITESMDNVNRNIADNYNTTMEITNVEISDSEA